MACSQTTEDYRCYATGELVVSSADARAFKMIVRLHKKKCPICAKYDDGKVHRFTHQVRDGAGRGGTAKSNIKHYKDTNYENGIPDSLECPRTKRGTYEGGQASNGGATGGVSILSAESKETSLTAQDLVDLVGTKKCGQRNNRHKRKKGKKDEE